MISIAAAMIAGYVVGAFCVALFLVLFMVMARSRENANAYTQGRAVGQYEQELHRQNQKLKEAQAREDELKKQVEEMKAKKAADEQELHDFFNEQKERG